jgi:hypothetical protein
LHYWQIVRARAVGIVPEPSHSPGTERFERRLLGPGSDYRLGSRVG